jgi:ribonuclease HI
MENTLVIYTDGACAGNPGMMGIGGVIKDKMTNKILHMFSMPKGTGNNNRAEVLAVIQALESTADLKLCPASIEIQSDSHEVMYMLLNRVKAEEILGDLLEKVHGLIKEFNFTVSFKWIPKDKNILANALAYKAAQMPIFLIEGNEIVRWTEEMRTLCDENSKESLPEINPETKADIELLNSMESVNPSLLINLMTFGMDKYSRAKTQDLLKYIEIRFGEYTKNYVVKTLEDLQQVTVKML